MRKVYIILVFMVLIFGMSSVLALEEPTEENVAVSGGGGGASGQLISAVSTPTVTTSQMYVVNAELMKELERLVTMLEEAEEKNDVQEIEGIQEKILEIKKLIKKDMAGYEQSTTQTVQMVEVEIVEPTEIFKNSCAELADWEQKKKHYEDLYSLSDEELKNKGYRKGKEEIKNILEELEEGIEKLKKECEAKVTNSGGGGQGGGCYDTDGGINIYVKGIAAGIWDSCISDDQISERYCTEMNMGADYICDCPLGYSCKDGACVDSNSGEGSVAIPSDITIPTEKIAVTITKPVVMKSGEEITEYYKIRVTDVMSKEVETEKQIAELKELRDEIDKLVEELIKSKDEIRTEEISELVKEIHIKPNEIKVDNTVIVTTGKNVITKVNKNDFVIKPTETEVIIQDKNLEIKAPELSIKDEVLVVGNSEVKLTASDVVEKIDIEPKEIELVEENAKAVYKIKAYENRNLLGVIPVNVEKSLTADATTNPETGIIEEEMPWWAFLTTE